MSSTPASINDKILKLTDPWLPEPQVDSSSTMYLGKHLVTRFYHLLIIPVEVITRLADGILGLAGYIATIVTWGKSSSTFDFTIRHLSSFMGGSSAIVQRTLLVINAKTKMRVEKQQARAKCMQEYVHIGMDLGLVSAAFMNAMEPFLKKSSTAFSEKLAKASLTIPLFFTSLIDNILGIVASVFSVLTLGTWTKCNNFAYEHLNLEANCELATCLFFNLPNFSDNTSEIHHEDDDDEPATDNAKGSFADNAQGPLKPINEHDEDDEDVTSYQPNLFSKLKKGDFSDQD